jgi:hypothetical protein
MERRTLARERRGDTREKKLNSKTRRLKEEEIPGWAELGVLS